MTSRILAITDLFAQADPRTGTIEIPASQDYSPGLTLAVYQSSAGRFILRTLLIRENLGTNPVAERLLRKLLNDAAARSKSTLVRADQ